MAITSNIKGFKVVGGTTLITEQSAVIKEQTTEKEVKLYKHIQIIVCPYCYKALKLLALEKDITLGKLLQEVIESYLEKEDVNYGKRKEIN